MTSRTPVSVACLAILLVAVAPAYGQITYTGLEHSAVGGATLDLDQGGRLRVSNLGSSGQDGVSIAPGGADGVAVRISEPDNFGEIGDNVQFNPLATGGPGLIPPPSFTLEKVLARSYAISIDSNAGGPVGNGGDVFLDFLDADGGVVQTLPVSTAGVAGDFVFPVRAPEGFFAIENRDVLKTYFETGDVPTEAQFNPQGGGNPIPGIHGFQLRYPETDLDGFGVNYAPHTAPGVGVIERTFAQKFDGVAAGVPGGAVYTGIGDARLTAGDSLAVDNLGSSGEDGVSISFGGPDLSGGRVAGVRVDKFEVRQEFGPTTGGRRSSVHGNPLYESSGAAGQSAIYEGSISGNAGGGIDLFFEIGELNSDQAELRVSQPGMPLVNEVVIGLQDKVLFASITDGDSSTELVTTMTPDTLRWTWPLDTTPRSLTTPSGVTVPIDPSLPLEIEMRVIGATNTPSGFGRVDLLYADAPGSVSLTGFAIPEPASAALLVLAFAAGRLARPRE